MNGDAPLNSEENFLEWVERAWQARRAQEARNNDSPTAPDNSTEARRIGVKRSATPDTRQQAIKWVEEGIKWMEEGRSLLASLRALLEENEQAGGSASQEKGVLHQEEDVLQRTREEIVTVVPEGDLDLASASRMKLQDYLDAGKTKLVLDLGGVAYIDSSGLGEVVRAMKRARQAGGDLRLCGVREDVLQIFEMTGLNKAIAIYPTRQEAVSSWK